MDKVSQNEFNQLFVQFKYHFVSSLSEDLMITKKNIFYFKKDYLYFSDTLDFN
jgi:hypothetical protein